MKIVWLIILAVITAVAVCIAVTIMYHEDTENQEFVIDTDDYISFTSEKTGRSEPGSYDKKAGLFMEKALTDDDINGDGVSTLSNCLSHLSSICGNENLSTKILSYVREMRYMTDSELYGTFDWAAYPVETIVKGGGDCEDLAILAVALLHRAGYSCGILLFQDHAVAIAAVALETEGGNGLSPISVAVAGTTYHCLETTADFPIGYTFGDYSESDIRSFVIARIHVISSGSEISSVKRYHGCSADFVFFVGLQNKLGIGVYAGGIVHFSRLLCITP